MTDVNAAHAVPGRELYTRHALAGGSSVAMLRIVDYADYCLVEAEVWPKGADTPEPVRMGPYTFPSAVEATRFVTHALEALMVLGCEVKAA